MKQLLLRKGRISIEDVPPPALGPRSILVEVSHSVISTGTELASFRLSRASLLQKAKQKPEEVSKVLNSIRVRGIRRTFALVNERLDESRPLGYSCAGDVIAVGADVKNFQAGDRVACAGAGFANHAEIVSVPETLTVKIPADLSNFNASFVTLGAIALQGVRRSDARLGENICVIGLGLIGQITVQILKAAGCRVFGHDPDANRAASALNWGAVASTHEPARLKSAIDTLTNGLGVDATILTASTESDEPAQLAFEITRKKGKIVVVGAVGMSLSRSPFYEKEQDFLISCSYGPGRYDPTYESEGHDYPYAFVRWTENRNMSAFLDLVASGAIRVEALAERKFPIEQAAQAYELLSQSGSKPLAVVLEYPKHKSGSLKSEPVIVVSTNGRSHTGKIRLGLIGFGNFSKTTHVPVLRGMADRVKLAGLCTLNSATAASGGRQLGCDFTTTDYRELLKRADIDAVIVTTRHQDHAQIAEAALRSGKHIYLEKPLALTMEEMEMLDNTVRSLTSCPVFMVGFNRRFSPHTALLKKTFANRQGPLIAIYRVNAGPLPPHHWALTEEGGGRLRGEACHMVDFFRMLIGQPLTQASIVGIGDGMPRVRPDENFSAQFKYDDGSVATLIYTSLGHPDVPKEWIEISAGGTTMICDDFRELRGSGVGPRRITGAQKKGHAEALHEFIRAIQTGLSFPIPWDELAETTKACTLLDAEVAGKIHANHQASPETIILA